MGLDYKSCFFESNGNNMETCILAAKRREYDLLNQISISDVRELFFFHLDPLRYSYGWKSMWRWSCSGSRWSFPDCHRKHLDFLS